MKLNFDNESLKWLKENGFDENESEKLLELLKVMNKKHEDKESFFIPKGTSNRVSAMLSSMNLVDGTGKFTWVNDNTVTIIEESKNRFPEAMELEEVEGERIEVGRASKKLLKPRTKQA